MSLTTWTWSLAITTYLIWTIWLNIWWIELLILSFSLYIIQFSIDAITWYRAARKQKKVLSWISIQWLMDKFTIFLFWWLLICISSTIYSIAWDYRIELFWYYIKIAYIILFFPHIFWILINFWEFISIVENMSIIFKDKKEWIVFNFLSYLSNKVFNTSLDVLTKMVENKIDKKFQKYINNNLKNEND